MKQLISFHPIFDPIAKTLDFSNIPNFSVDKLYAVINTTRNQPIYVPGAPGLGYSTITGGGEVLTLQWDTSSYSTGDLLNVYYDTPAEDETNEILLKVAEYMERILRELKVQSIILSEGLNIKNEDIDELRNSDSDL